MKKDIKYYENQLVEVCKSINQEVGFVGELYFQNKKVIIGVTKNKTHSFITRDEWDSSNEESSNDSKESTEHRNIFIKKIQNYLFDEGFVSNYELIDKSYDLDNPNFDDIDLSFIESND